MIRLFCAGWRSIVRGRLRRDDAWIGFIAISKFGSDTLRKNRIHQAGIRLRLATGKIELSDWIVESGFTHAVNDIVVYGSTVWLGVNKVRFKGKLVWASIV